VEVLRQISSVLFVFILLGMVFGLARRGRMSILRKPGRADATDSLILAARVSLTPHHALHHVRVGKKDLLVVTHPKGCTVIQEDVQARSTRA
jgi:hypothetical protein